MPEKSLWSQSEKTRYRNLTLQLLNQPSGRRRGCYSFHAYRTGKSELIHPFEGVLEYTKHRYKGRKNRNRKRNSATAYKIHLGRLQIIPQSNQTRSTSNNEQEETTPSHWLPVQENTQTEKDTTP